MKEKNKKNVPFGTKPVINNIVASGRFPKNVSIDDVFKKVKFAQAEFNPETYPALLVKIKISSGLKHVTLYKNGKFIIAGATSEKEVNEIYDEIVKILHKNGFL